MARTDFLKRDFSLEKQDSKIPLIFAGKVKGYYTIVSVNETGYGAGTFEIQIGVSTTTEEEVAQIDQLKQVLLERFNPQFIVYELNRLVITGEVPLRKKKFEEQVSSLINETIEFISQHQLLTGDFLTGENDETVSLYQINNTYMYLSSQSYQDVKKDHESDIDSPQKSIGQGLSGAVIGALIGAVILGVLLYFGFYGWIAGIIGVHLAFHFYRKKNGLFNVSGVLVVLGIVIFALFLANYAVYAIVMTQTLQRFNFTFSMVLLNLLPILQEVELMSAFMIDLFLGIGVAALYAAANTYRVYQTSKNEGRIRKL